MRININHSERFSVLFESVTGQKLHQPVTGIVTDSRECQKGDLYVALSGKRVDGHGYLPVVTEQGASAALVSRVNEELNIQQVLVEDPLMTIGTMGHNWRKQFDIPVIGITGSNGKTSTKDLLVHVLSSIHRVHATEGNFNTSVGLPLTLLTLDDSHSISILELGANQPGDIEYLCTIVEPTHGIITNIAPAHLEGFGSVEAIAKSKSSLFNSLENGIAFVNTTDERIVNFQIPGEKVTFGLSSDCDFPADIHQENDGTLILILDTHEIATGTMNLSFVKNCIAVSSIAVTLGVKWEEIIGKIQSFTPPPGRCQVKQLVGITVIDDTYNANLVSSLAALDYLKAFSGNGRKIFVFGDMFELGETAPEQHVKVGEKCNEIKIDGVFTIGENAIHTDSAINGGIEHRHFSSPADLIRSLKKNLHAGDKVLFKGSRGMAMERIIERVFEN